MTTTTRTTSETTGQASPAILAEFNLLRDELAELSARVDAEEARRR